MTEEGVSVVGGAVLPVRSTAVLIKVYRKYVESMSSNFWIFKALVTNKTLSGKEP